MTIESPLWMQNVKYPARIDRSFIERLMRSQERVFDGLQVVQEGAGTFNVTITAGAAAVLGDDTAEQGMYFVRVTADETVAVPASPPSGSRIDSVVLSVRDAQAGGPAGDDAVLEIIEGGSSVPSTSVLLATITRSSSEGAILTSAIVDARPLGQYPYTVSTTAPPAGVGVEGDLWVQVQA